MRRSGTDMTGHVPSPCLASGGQKVTEGPGIKPTTCCTTRGWSVVSLGSRRHRGGGPEAGRPHRRLRGCASPALIITCGHKATETSLVAECLPALEGSRAERRCARIQMSSLWCGASWGKEVGNGACGQGPGPSAATVHPRPQLGALGKGRTSWLR